jgi:hypothetical protein
MQPDDTEKAFRQKMKSHTPAWDKAKNWDAIEARLPQQRKRRPVWLFWLLGGVILAGSLLWWAWFATGEKTAAEPLANTTEITGNQSNTPTTGVDEILAGNISPQAETTTGPNASQNTANDDAAPFVFKKTKPQNGLATSATKSTSRKFFGEKTQHETPVPPSVGTTAPMDGNASAAISPQAANTVQDLADHDETAPQRRASDLEKLPTEARPLDLPQTETAPSAAIAAQIKVVKNQPRFGLEIYGGIGQPLRRFSAVSPEKQAYISERQGLENVLESIEAGVLLTARFRGGWSLATGLEFQKINERFHWQQVTAETVNVYSDSAYFYFDAVNQRQFIGDTVQATLTESRRVTNFNTHTFLNMPLLVGFEKRLPHFSLRAQGGPVLQFYRGFEGVIFDENGDLRPAAGQGIYQNKMALSLQAGLDVCRPVGSLGEVFIGLQYRHGLTSLTIAEAGFEQRYGGLGARLGWRF